MVSEVRPAYKVFKSRNATGVEGMKEGRPGKVEPEDLVEYFRNDVLLSRFPNLGPLFRDKTLLIVRR